MRGRSATSTGRAWLVKTEPSTYSFDRLVREQRATWDGVTNAQAINNLRLMAKGDRVWVYHTGDDKAIVGLARVVRGAYEDPARPGRTGAGEVKFVVVDLEPLARAPRELPLSEIKADARLADLPLVKHSRLSVMPVPEACDTLIRELAGL